ncbi:hypothetical protein M514_08366 [Trichuris suis]|uniref:Uncharacterized protein n=1 Tax=Trichuris suis TaxID=68888 RepID=A0A085N137_9BILA|nr:hypothetical protein M514_08366 [Trichuris suis]
MIELKVAQEINTLTGQNTKSANRRTLAKRQYTKKCVCRYRLVNRYCRRRSLQHYAIRWRRTVVRMESVCNCGFRETATVNPPTDMAGMKWTPTACRTGLLIRLSDNLREASPRVVQREVRCTTVTCIFALLAKLQYDWWAINGKDPEKTDGSKKIADFGTDSKPVEMGQDSCAKIM